MTTAERATTGIGSLPHHNIDSALSFSMQMGIPFLPQIPIRNPWEFMIAQALEDLPGLQAEKDGSVILDLDIWSSRAHGLTQRLSDAFARSDSDKAAFEAFEPSSAVSSSWQPFVWELTENKVHLAKVQIAGPITAQWALRFSEGSATLDKFPDLTTQIYRLILARALAMTRRLQANGIQPLIYLDEPALYGLSLENPRHVLALQELKLLIQTLRKEGVLVGLHCCSNTDWSTVLGLNLHYLSVDTELSLKSLLSAPGNATENFLRTGGRLSLGVIPTTRSAVLHSINIQELFAHLLEIFSEKWGSKPELVKKTLAEAIYTPACGLALHSVSDAELVLEILNDFYDYCTSTVISRSSGSA
jgi:hypothetical protein